MHLIKEKKSYNEWQNWIVTQHLKFVRTPHKLFFYQQPLQWQKASKKSEKKVRTSASLWITSKFDSLTECDRAVDNKIVIQQTSKTVV